MARLPRLHVPGGCYHVTLRGNHREAIFDCEQDRRVLNDIVGEVICKCGARMHAYCWMSNHVHMLIQVPDLPLGHIVRRIAQRYALYRHKRLKTGGHLFERRHGSKLIEVDAYFLAVLKYIHLNPIAAKVVERIADYPWSSHHAYIGKKKISWVTTDFGLSLFAENVASARAGYRQFIGMQLTDDERSHILKRNSGDSRIIGTDQYIERISDAVAPSFSTITLEQLCHRICAQFGITLDQLQSPRRSRAISYVRAELAHRAIDDRIATLSEIARFLRRSPSSVFRLMERHRFDFGEKRA